MTDDFPYLKPNLQYRGKILIPSLLVLTSTTENLLLIVGILALFANGGGVHLCPSQIHEGLQTDVAANSWVDKHRGHKFQFCCLSHISHETLLVKLQLGSWVKVPKPEDSDMMVFADKFILRLI